LSLIQSGTYNYFVDRQMPQPYRFQWMWKKNKTKKYSSMNMERMRERKKNNIPSQNVRCRLKKTRPGPTTTPSGPGCPHIVQRIQCVDRGHYLFIGYWVHTYCGGIGVRNWFAWSVVTLWGRRYLAHPTTIILYFSSVSSIVALDKLGTLCNSIIQISIFF